MPIMLGSMKSGNQHPIVDWESTYDHCLWNLMDWESTFVGEEQTYWEDANDRPLQGLHGYGRNTGSPWVSMGLHGQGTKNGS